MTDVTFARNAAFSLKLDRSEYNGACCLVVGPVNDAGRVPVILTGSSGKRILVKPIALEACALLPHVDIPDDLFKEQSYLLSVASDNAPRIDCGEDAARSSVYATREFLKKQPLGLVFLLNNEDVFATIHMLAETRGMKMVTQELILNNYFEGVRSGSHEPVSGEPITVMINGGGVFEQAICAGLKLLYAVGPRGLDHDDMSVIFYMEGDTTNVRVSYKFNGHFVELCLLETESDCHIFFGLA